MRFQPSLVPHITAPAEIQFGEICAVDALNAPSVRTTQILFRRNDNVLQTLQAEGKRSIRTHASPKGKIYQISRQKNYRQSCLP
jgi:hypothetical protein